VYHNVLAVELRGVLDRAALEHAVGAVAARHESLRTRFAADGGLAVQEVLAEAAITVVDLAAGGPRPDTVQEAVATARVWAGTQFPFGPGSAPPLRVSLTPIGQADSHLLVIAVHHLISDGDSMTIILRELLAAYEARVRGLPDPLTAPPAQFLDVMTRTWPAGDASAAGLAFWREHLAGAQGVLDLPLDRPRPAKPSHHGAVCQRIFRPETVAAVRELARGQRVSVFMIVLASIAVLLTRLAATPEAVLGVPMSLRRDPASRGAVGYLVNTIALRVPADPDATVADLLGQVRRITLRGYDRAHVPFSSVVKELRPPRRPDHHPVFQVLVAFTDRGDAAATQYAQRIAGLELAFPSVEPARARMDLSFCVHEVAGTLAVDVEYATDLCGEPTAAALAAALEHLLAASASAPAQPIGTLPLAGARPAAAAGSEGAGRRAGHRSARSRLGADSLGGLLSQAADLARRVPDQVVLSCPACALTAADLHLASRTAPLASGTTPCHAVAAALHSLRTAGDLAAALNGGPLAPAGSFGPADPACLAAAAGWLLASSSPLGAAQRVVIAGLGPATAVTVLLAQAIACRETFIGDAGWAAVLRADGSDTVVGPSAALLAGWAEVIRCQAGLAGVLVIGEPPLPQPWAELAQAVGGCPVSYAGGPAELGGIAFAGRVTAGVCTGRMLGHPLEPSRVTITDGGGPVPPRLAGVLSIRLPGSAAAAQLCRARAVDGGVIEMIGPLPAPGDPASPPLCQVEGVIAGLGGIGDVHAGWRPGPRGRRLCADLVAQPGTGLTASEVTGRVRGALAAHLAPEMVTILPALPGPAGGWLRRGGPAGRPDRLGARLMAALTE
jgi:hypothetical protein